MQSVVLLLQVQIQNVVTILVSYFFIIKKWHEMCRIGLEMYSTGSGSEELWCMGFGGFEGFFTSSHKSSHLWECLQVQVQVVVWLLWSPQSLTNLELMLVPFWVVHTPAYIMQQVDEIDV